MKLYDFGRLSNAQAFVTLTRLLYKAQCLISRCKLKKEARDLQRGWLITVYQRPTIYTAGEIFRAIRKEQSIRVTNVFITFSRLRYLSFSRSPLDALIDKDWCYTSLTLLP